MLDVLEECGHPTGRSQPGTQVGYTHSLGHGLGIQVHEAPSFSHLRDEDVIQVGNVFTIEPGVYYPDKGFGIRVEDTVYVAEDGTMVDSLQFSVDSSEGGTVRGIVPPGGQYPPYTQCDGRA